MPIVRRYLPFASLILVLAIALGATPKEKKRLSALEKAQRKDLKLLEGEWDIKKHIRGDGKPGTEYSKIEIDEFSLQFDPHLIGKGLEDPVDALPAQFAYCLDPTKKPKQIDFGIFTADGHLGLGLKGIYELTDGETPTWRLAFGLTRPKSFKRSKNEKNSRWLTLEKEIEKEKYISPDVACVGNLRAIQSSYFLRTVAKKRPPNENRGTIGILSLFDDELGPESLVCPRGDETVAEKDEDGEIRLKSSNVSYRFVSPLPAVRRNHILAYCLHDHNGERLAVLQFGQVVAEKEAVFRKRLKKEGAKLGSANGSKGKPKRKKSKKHDD